MDNHKKFLEMNLKRFKEILEEKRKNFKSSNAYNEEKKRNGELKLELKNLQHEPIEYSTILEENMLELQEFIKFYSEKVNQVENDEDKFSNIEEKYEKNSLAVSEIAKLNNKHVMTFEELVKQKEEYIKELAEITGKLNSLDTTSEKCADNLKQQINEYEEITKNINNSINSGVLNSLSSLVDKKKAELINIDKKYHDLEAERVILESKNREKTVLLEDE